MLDASIAIAAIVACQSDLICNVDVGGAEDVVAWEYGRQQKAWAAQGKRSLNACARSEPARSLRARNIKRRELKTRELRERLATSDKSRMNLRTAADLAKWDAISHNQTGVSNAATVFDTETSCIFAPVIIDSPYSSGGVPMHVEIHGISDQGNYAADGWNSTYLRDIQPTDKDGVVFFDTIFPGHYSGRATHTHLLIRSNATLLPNGTLLVNSGSITHNGQLFFHEELRSAVEATYPYKTDTIAVTSNADDQWAKRSMTPSRTIAAYIQADGGFEITGAHKFTRGNDFCTVIIYSQNYG
ncbi:uncharacterized protein N7529_005455 [Penicillium soppii]|uniref:uncharacterized protein n=1 Tax=Penicillium soppii TaxID=69789 RepID=UPI0025482D5C|nr:uncharacterized protein N7529_005455 [Penicillium soppii]KAJ5863539.1 hypothetical protein N7529_005455 [Penicillium soppii]